MTNNPKYPNTLSIAARNRTAMIAASGRLAYAWLRKKAGISAKNVPSPSDAVSRPRQSTYSPRSMSSNSIPRRTKAASPGASADGTAMSISIPPPALARRAGSIIASVVRGTIRRRRSCALRRRASIVSPDRSPVALPAAVTPVTTNSQALDAGTVVSPKLRSLRLPAAVNAKKSVATTDRVAAMNLRKRSNSPPPS
jgi:hypothetical protein